MVLKSITGAASTQTVSYLKKHAAELPLDEPMVITQNGLPKYVVESYEDKVKRDEAMALMKLIAMGKQSIKTNPQTIEDVEAFLSDY